MKNVIDPCFPFEGDAFNVFSKVLFSWCRHNRSNCNPPIGSQSKNSWILFCLQFCRSSNNKTSKQMLLGCLTLGKWNSTLLKNVNNCWNTNIYFCLETSGGQKSNLYLNIVLFSTLVLIRLLWQLKTVVFLHMCPICAILLSWCCLWCY